MPRGLLLLALLAASGAALAKTGRTYYTPERLAVMRENIDRHPWAKETAQAILKRADRWVAYDDERILVLVPPPGCRPARMVSAASP